MERRELLGTLGAGAVGILASGTAIAGQGKEGGRRHGGDDEHEGHHRVIDECARVCNETIAECLGRHGHGDSHDHQHHKAVVALLDCQEFCGLTSTLTARESPMLPYAYRACARACRDCAEVCEQAKGDMMKRCAEVCRRCERHCEEHSRGSSSDDHRG